MIRKTAWFLIITSLLAMLADATEWQLPTMRWAFNACRQFQLGTALADGSLWPWPAYVLCSLNAMMGGLVLWKIPKNFHFTPITQRRIRRFKEIRRGYVSFLIILGLAALAALDQLVVGNEAIIVKYENQWHFPALKYRKPKNRDFGRLGDLADTEPNYRSLKADFATGGPQDKASDGSNNWVLMPLVPYAPTGDTLAPQLERIEQREDQKFYQPHASTPFSGVLAKVYDVNAPERMHSRFQVRNGVPSGNFTGWSTSGERVLTADFKDGLMVHKNYTGSSSVEDFLKIGESLTTAISHSNPVKPIPEHGHLLGTTSSGYDVLAYLYGGLQVNFKAALIYIPIVYLIGITIGLLMGYFGGTFDLIIQRLIEIFSTIPFLYVVIIVSGGVPDTYKSLGPILAILVVFGWMGMTYLMRTSALKEKARDYVAASRTIGCSTPRILFKHILPNSVAILVTLVPFSVSGLIMALTSLDYLGFGLPEKYPTWGRLLQDGLDNLSALWLASSAFAALVCLLILVTFVGEAIREAFDPKKFTTYQ